MVWQKEIDGIALRRKLAADQGGSDNIARQHAAGKLTVRERIEALLDAGSFREHGKIAGGALLDDDGELAEFTPANYVVGMGKISGRTIAIGGEDFTVKGGSPNASGLRKSIYAEHLAVTYRVPLVRLLEGGGGSVDTSGGDPKKPKTVGSPLYEIPRFQIIAEAMGAVPIVSAALGPVAGFPAGRLVASHFSVMTAHTAQIMIGGPKLVKRALGKDLTKEELGGSAIHASSGVVDNIAKDEADAFEQMRQFLSYLPQNVWQRAPRLACTDPIDRCADELKSIVPRSNRQAFDMKKIIEWVVDEDSFFHMSPHYGPSLIVGLARINGQALGITANDCRHLAGAMTAEAAQKMRRMIEFCETFHLPIVNFVDEPGFMIGLEAERAMTIRYGMAAVSAAAQARVPWASIRVRKSFGVASAAHYGPDAYILDWPSVESGALPLEGGVAIAFHRQIEAAEDPQTMRETLEEQMRQARSPYRAAESFATHELIDPRETRPLLCDWVEWIQPRLEHLLGEAKFSMRP